MSKNMSQSRAENICQAGHLRVILPSTLDATMNMPAPFIDIITSNTHDIPPPQVDFSAPPPYDVAANSKLPTYEEVQREKQMEGDGPAQMPAPPPRHSTITAFVTVEPTESTTDHLDPENSLLGTDVMFLTSFFVAFLFNWIGFLLLMCFCHTVASRYGALAGFGLSLAKWTLIVKHSTELASHENSWLWWLIMAFGILICVRAVIQYLNIKRGWRLLSGTAQERLLFFY
ncbi:NEDD4 family-interacting protein 1 isoform X2 [Papilio machaon]|uniref:NEDD4 family-interacting protein 1 isoform X2 n=1 Tax=Papilio machaon TaxID=76193 RepID=UPI001E665BDC|nr:NEDD4 family-interacting protein 1 isoform X2 [Papilio machaon]